MKTEALQAARLRARIEVQERRLLSMLAGTETDAAFIAELYRRERRVRE